MPGPAWLFLFPSEAMLYALHTDGNTLTLLINQFIPDVPTTERGHAVCSAYRWLPSNFSIFLHPPTPPVTLIQISKVGSK